MVSFVADTFPWCFSRSHKAPLIWTGTKPSCRICVVRCFFIIFFSTIRQSSSINFLLKLRIQLIKSLTGKICKGNKCRWQTKLFNIFILHTLESKKIKVMKNGKFPMNFLLDSLSSCMWPKSFFNKPVIIVQSLCQVFIVLPWVTSLSQGT